MKKPARKTPVKIAMIAVLMLVPVTAQAAQGAAPSQDNSGAPKKPAKPSRLSGKIGPDGKTFTADKDGRIWQVSNPELLAGVDVLHVKVKAFVNAAVSEMCILSVTTLAEPHSGINYGDAAFRR
jgi:hypothetical protein